MKKLYYIHDPMCSWCWGFNSTWNEVETAIKGKFEVECNAFLKLSFLLSIVILSIPTTLAQSLNAGVLPPIVDLVLQDSEVEPPVIIPNGVTANIKSLTRVNGVSPETVYFSAESSTCSNCEDLWGLNTQIAIVYSELAYHFNFDDSDSGDFATTGNSRNQQVSSSPRAIHTFECSGVDDPNWDSEDERCEFNVGVRVQSKEGVYNDDFIQINIQPQYGVGGYYSDADIYCVSSDSDYTDCPHGDSSRHLTNTPSIGNWHESLVLFESGSSGTYSTICMGADEQHATAATYSSGSRPVISNIILSSRPGSCNSSYGSDSRISILSDNHPERDANGHLIDGFAFNQTVTGLRVGAVSNGQSFALLNYHNLDMDWSADSSSSGEFTFINNASGCRNDTDLSCSNIPYASFLFLTDTVIASHVDNLASPTNIGCFNGCAAVNFGIAGVDVGTAVEHNIRMQGAWGVVFSNNYLRGNHIGGKGPKAAITVRTTDSDGANDLSKNPENLTGTDYLRGDGATTEFFNAFNVGIDNRFNQPEQSDISQMSSRFLIAGNYTAEFGSNYQEVTAGDCGNQSSLHNGYYRTVRNINWNPCALADLGLSDYYDDDTVYSDSSTVYVEGSASGTRGNFSQNTPVLSLPSAPSL